MVGYMEAIKVFYQRYVEMTRVNGMKTDESSDQLNQAINQNITRKDFLKLSVKAVGVALVTPYTLSVLSGCDNDPATYPDPDPDPTAAYKNIIQFYVKTINLGIGFGKFMSELESLIMHMYTPEEALVVQHLYFLKGRTVKEIYSTNKIGYSKKEIEEILNDLASRQLVFHYGQGQFDDFLIHIDNRMKQSTYPFDNPKPPLEYSLLPLLPGMFEYCLINGAANDEHKQELARRFETLHSAGYTSDWFMDKMQKLKGRQKLSRYIPVEETVASPNYTTFPSDSLTEIFASTEKIAVGICQCKQSKFYSGFTNCISSTMETCMVTGAFADHLVGKGMMRMIDRSEAIDIKVRANEEGLVTWGLNVGVHQSNMICSCCKCCCFLLQALIELNELNVPGAGIHVKPNYYPQQKENTNCVKCGRCVKYCPTNARKFVLDSLGNRLFVSVDANRCIGCGVCNVKCSQNILTMNRIKRPVHNAKNYVELAAPLGYYLAMEHLKNKRGLTTI
jgi:Pyruvate/2-oxoacid:ferredoxin oxidoreductase delta subunit